MQYDHTAIPSSDIAASVEWYKRHLGARVLFADVTWAFLDVGGAKLALVTPTQHPPHVAMRVTAQQLEEAAQSAHLPIDSHRDGTRGIYLRDPSGNAVELICYPAGETVYQPEAAVT